MSSRSPYDPAEVFPALRRRLGPKAWEGLTQVMTRGGGPEAVAAALEDLASQRGLPPWLAELARVEHLCWQSSQEPSPPAAQDDPLINPGLKVLETGWRGLARLSLAGGQGPDPAQGQARVGSWPLAQGGAACRELNDGELLALKMVAEGLDPQRVAAETGAGLGVFSTALASAARAGLVLRPGSRLRRQADAFPDLGQGERFTTAPVFTLQWHVTQACDLNCRHCYDRSPREAVSLPQGLDLMDQLWRFCWDRHVDGQVTFTGGNPLLHPDLPGLVAGAGERGLTVGILGNPVGAERLDEVLEAGRPAFYQVSLEGLAQQNDYMRGAGHFQRTMDFLELLGRRGIRRSVMLTLTRDNMDQVIPLARELGGRCEEFNFNRLAPVGQGANLALPEPEDFRRFLGEYLAEARESQVMGLKDSLFNLTLAEEGQGPVGGCTGFGCGAAFNFLAVLPQGEVHACRKADSPVGDLRKSSLAEIYDSPQAEAWRTRSTACAGCGHATVCGGCPAVMQGLGMDPAADRDPFCFASA